MILILFLITLFSQPVTAYPDPRCVEWFEKSKLPKDTKNCESDCSVLMVDMGTFLCRNQCPELCSQGTLANYIFYPGLPPSEKALINKYPKESLIVFMKKLDAEKLSLLNFPDQDVNDEGDAFRHFIWAAELTNELGTEIAQKFLDAHEEDTVQKPEIRAMDLANNRGGILTAQKMIKNKTYTSLNLVQEALDQLRNKKMSVLKPGLEIPKDAK